MNEIESYLYDVRVWISAKQISYKFNINERQLRGENSPLKSCAISGDQGYRHIAWASPEEINHFCARLTAHATEELKRVARIKEIRKNYEERQMSFA